MKFMKLGSKPDQFQTEGDNIRYVSTELETDMVINVGVVKFYLHKFPVLSKSYRLQKLVATTNGENTDEINIDDIPGGPAAFEVCVKFCYNMTVTLNAYNVVAARCAAEYLEMYESVEKGNLIYKIEVFLASSILRSRKDSIIMLQTARAFLPWSEELKIVIDSMTSLLPTEKKSVSVSFLIRLLQMAIALECGDTVRNELKRRISVQLEEATVGDLLIRDTKTGFDVDLVHDLVYHFMIHQKNRFQELCPVFASDDSKVKVARIIDGYLAEVSSDPTLLLSKFVGLAELVSGFPRPLHDGIYRAIDMYLKEHPWITKSERKRICKLMDCKKLSAEACTHAVQNERLPLRVVVQVLFFEQVRATSSSGGGCTPDPTGPLKSKLLTVGSYGSSTTATSNTDEDWDAVPSAKELRALKCDMKTDAEKVSKKIYSKLRSSNSSTDTSESPSSSNAGEIKPISCKSRRESPRGLVRW